MSSNPFRRSKLPEQLAPTTPTAADEVVGEAPSKRTKKKRVKIQTPPHSPEANFTQPENGGRRLSAADASGRAGSPPPPVFTVDESEDESDSTATADSELEEALKNTRSNSGSLPSPDKAPASAMRAPYNPFARTLASSDAGFGLMKENTDEPGKAQRQGAGSGRAALDVDAFKNILLTGSATPSPPSSVAGATAPSVAPNTTFTKPHDSSSSNTDTSSIFDRNYGMQLESPRNSFDDYESASESDDDEQSGLMGQGRSDDLAPPAPPKPKIRGPQTVSFADFDQSIPEGFQSSGPRTPPVNTHITGILRPSTPRSSSDLNKPLPPPPPPPAETSNSAPPDVPEKSLTPSRLPTPTIIAEDATPKKAPPPPPTRRKVGDASRPRSSSNLSQEPSYPPDEDESTSKPAPPPPPTRKPQAMASVSGINSEAGSERTSPSQSTTEVPKAVPPPPPRRNPSKTGPSPRQSESPMQKPGDAFLAAVAPSQANAPPAPPPRRAGGSKRSSMDGAPDSLHRRVSSEYARRPSGNSFDSDRSGFMSNLQQVAEPGESNEHALATPSDSQRDILADMSAFQAEIEALRLQSQNSR